jgi:hypothetical protein
MTSERDDLQRVMSAVIRCDGRLVRLNRAIRRLSKGSQLSEEAVAEVLMWLRRTRSLEPDVNAWGAAEQPTRELGISTSQE